PITDLLRAEHWLKIFPLEETKRMICEFEFAAMSGIDTFSGEYRFFNRERSEGLADIRGKVIRYESVKPISGVGMTSDVTEMRRAMKELEEHRQKVFALSKLNTLGELASGIGHELNTPLSAILSKIARVECAIDGEKEKGLLRESMEIIERISQIVDGLKQLSRNRQFDNAREKIDPAFSIEQALSLSRARFSNHGFRIEFFRPPKSLRCIGNQTTLFQALVNLLNNAFDALD